MSQSSVKKIKDLQRKCEAVEKMTKLNERKLNTIRKRFEIIDGIKNQCEMAKSEGQFEKTKSPIKSQQFKNWNEFRSSFKGQKKSIKEISVLWREYKNQN